jgi:hypothetical protein
MLPHIYTSEEAAQALRISVKGLHALCRQGKIDYVRINGKARGFTSGQIQDYIESQTVSKVSVDRKPAKPLPCSPKKGGTKSVEDVGTSLRKEIRDLCR